MPNNANDTTIHIDKKNYKVGADRLTGAQLRGTPEPPIGADRDLYLEGVGKEEDRLIRDDTVVEIRNGMHFFTSPSTINPG